MVSILSLFQAYDGTGVALILAILVMIVLFDGEPDLHNTIIHILMEHAGGWTH